MTLTPKVLVSSHVPKRLPEGDRAQYIERKVLGDVGHVHGSATVLALDEGLQLKDACVDIRFKVVDLFARVLLSALAHMATTG
jgi:hypothetical protein